MYFRHLYAVQQPSLEARCESWANYQALFGVILHSNVNMQLPNGWLWDIIDEFVCVTSSCTSKRCRPRSFTGRCARRLMLHRAKLEQHPSSCCITRTEALLLGVAFNRLTRLVRLANSCRFHRLSYRNALSL